MNYVASRLDYYTANPLENQAKMNTFQIFVNYDYYYVNFIMLTCETKNE